MLSTERIENQNKIHALANQIEVDAIAMLTPWLNQKVAKISGNGGKVAKLEKEFETFAASHSCNGEGSGVWLNLFTRYCTLSLVVSHRASALTVDLYVGRVNEEGVLVEVKPHEPLRTDFSLEEVQGAFNQAEKLEAEARRLKSSVHVFQRR